MDNVFHTLSCSGCPVLFTSEGRQTCLSYEKNVFSVFFHNDSVNSKRGHPPWAFVGHLSCYWSRRWGIVRKPQPGVGHLSILLDAANVVLFSIFHLKKYVYLNNFKEVKRYMWFSLHHFPIPQYFFASVCFPPSSSVRIWRKNNKCIVRRVKGKDVFFVREWLSQKGLEKLCKIFES